MANDKEVNSKIVHWAGVIANISNRLRQRCIWCGAPLIDVNLENVTFPIPPGKTVDQAREDGDLTVATWEPGSWVAVDGPVTYVVRGAEEDRNYSETPEHSCARFDFEVTG